MKKLAFSLLVSTSLAAAAFACGGISDPTRSDGRIATVSGALTGTTVPANARVALIWRKGLSGGVEVGHDVAIVNGSFSMNVAVPPDAYFFNAEGARVDDSTPGAEPPSARPATPTEEVPPSAGGAGGKAITPALRPRDSVGGQITSPLEVAIAGFVVYVDTNGNGRLDLEGQYAASPDELIGGNRDLLLVNLRGGGALDYEKLRDRSSILPTSGFNLFWDDRRWVGLNLVELKITTAKLPSSVCSSSSVVSSNGVEVDEAPNVTTPPSPPSGGSGSGSRYPAPTDPDLQCSADGRSYEIKPSQPDCPPPAPTPVGLCASDDETAIRCGGRAQFGESLIPGEAVPPGWPCPVADADGGAAIDGGAFDAGAGD